MQKELLEQIAQQYATPTYLFDMDSLKERVKSIKALVGDKISLCYAIKANAFLIQAMSQCTDRLEVCSPGELSICERLGIDMDKVVFSGVNKTRQDVEQAFKNNVHIYTAESLKHLQMINSIAKENGRVLPVLLRLTSGNQFGMDESLVEEIVKNRLQYSGVEIKGLHFFSGTQKKKSTEIEKELEYIDNFCDALKDRYGFITERLEYGPGLRFLYFVQDGFTDTLLPLKEVLATLDRISLKYDLTIEMGRFFVSECGYYITEVMDTKQNKDVNYCIIDGGINHLNYYGQTLAMKLPMITHLPATLQHSKEETPWTICGSLCTTADVIVRNAPFVNLSQGDTLIFHNVGAYSITEGIYLFLSRKMPRVVVYSKETGAVLVRDFTETHNINGI